MIQYDSLSNEVCRWYWGETTSGYMLSSHSLSNPKPQTGNPPRELLSRGKKGTKSTWGGQKQFNEMIFVEYNKIALHFLSFTHC